jgi:hypothetical protein
MEPEDGEGELPAGFQGMEVDGRRFILTPEFNGKGERVERLKVATATRLVMLQNKKTTRYPNGRFHVLTTDQVKAWCSTRTNGKGKEKNGNDIAIDKVLTNENKPMILI